MSAQHGHGLAKRPVERRVIPVNIVTPTNFARYGQVVTPMEDGIPYGPNDAQLDLSRGIPRFYSMQLENRGNVFRHITRHKSVTQCLGSMLGTRWMLGVAAPDPDRTAPELNTLQAFVVPGDRFVKLEKGTWHAGPYFKSPTALFYNLELSDTNIVDHETCNLAELLGLEFEFANESDA
jgi:ureidoglycolate hydrolase